MKLSTDIEYRSQQFYKDLKENDYVYVLDTGNGFSVVESNHKDKMVMLVFSREAYAKAVCIEEWSAYKPKAIPTIDFKSHWLKGMSDDNLLVGVNFDRSLYGKELEPKEILDYIDNKS